MAHGSSTRQRSAPHESKVKVLFFHTGIFTDQKQQCLPQEADDALKRSSSQQFEHYIYDPLTVKEVITLQSTFTETCTVAQNLLTTSALLLTVTTLQYKRKHDIFLQHNSITQATEKKEK